jgi:formiminoglutamase
VPRLFDGELPDLNFGTNDGAACSQTLANRVVASATAQGFSHVLNGRFKGGFITRHYGRPGERVDAVQLELAQRTYMNESNTLEFEPARAAALVVVLRRVILEMLCNQ